MTIVAQGAYSWTVELIGRRAMPTTPNTTTKPRVTASATGMARTTDSPFDGTRSPSTPRKNVT